MWSGVESVAWDGPGCLGGGLDIPDEIYARDLCTFVENLIYTFIFQVVIRPMMYIALTYDHRLIDGREAVTFLRGIKKAVEDPRVMFLDL